MEFNRDYQEHLVAQLLTPGFLLEVSGLIHAEHFDQDLQPAVDGILEFYRKRKKLPTPPQLRQLIKGNIQFPKVSGSDRDFDIEQIRLFSKVRGLRNVLLDSMQKLQDGDLEDVLTALHRKIRDTESITSMSVDLFESGDDHRMNPVFTGMAQYDAVCGGVCSGEAAAVMAVSNGGKSSFLTHIGASALEAGKNVFHVSLEMRRGAIRQKYLSRLSEATEGKGKAKVGKRKPSSLGRCMVFDPPPGSIRMLEVVQQVRKLPFKPDLVIIDSVENIRPTRFMQDRWVEEEGMASDFKSLTEEFGIAGWTSYQANRPGYGTTGGRNAEAGVIKLEHCKGSMDKVRLMDHVVSINQTENEMITDSSGRCAGRMYVAKERYGVRGSNFSLSIDFGRCRFEEM